MNTLETRNFVLNKAFSFLLFIYGIIDLTYILDKG